MIRVVNKKSLAILVLVASVVFLIGYLVWEALNAAGEAAFNACLASIGADLYKQGEKLPITLNKTPDWKLLNEADTETALKSVRLYDCQGKAFSEIEDPWGNKVLIAQASDSSGIIFLVWTAGRDNVSGNADDIVFPFFSKTIPAG